MKKARMNRDERKQARKERDNRKIRRELKRSNYSAVA